jgi:hypothetical protein
MADKYAGNDIDFRTVLFKIDHTLHVWSIEALHTCPLMPPPLWLQKRSVMGKACPFQLHMGLTDLEMLLAKPVTSTSSTTFHTLMMESPPPDTSDESSLVNRKTLTDL